MSENMSFDVRVWKIERYKRKDGYGYRVRWAVDGKRKTRSHTHRKLAESFRATLLAAARAGEGFDTETLLPARLGGSSQPEPEVPTWLANAIDFVDTKWDDASARHRKSTAEGLTTLTVALTRDAAAAPRPDMLRAALRSWCFNTSARRQREAPPSEFSDALRWIEANSLPVTAMAEADVVRRALAAIRTNLDGSRAAASSVARKRAALSGALKYAVERGHLSSNPLQDISTPRQPRAERLDTRVVANPAQARALLKAAKDAEPCLHAYFACLYYAGLRPAEARNLKVQDCTLPEVGWGELVVVEGYQESGAAWTDSGERGEERGLKHRDRKETRPVPAHPALVQSLRDHLDEFGTGVGGRLFVTRTGRGGHPVAPPFQNPVSMSSVYRVWKVARQTALTPQQQASPLARRPYDLRHACLSTWLSAGVPATRVAAWAGHSLAVLLRVYATCIDGEEASARSRIEAALASSPTD